MLERGGNAMEVFDFSIAWRSVPFDTVVEHSLACSTRVIALFLFSICQLGLRPIVLRALTWPLLASRHTPLQVV